MAEINKRITLDRENVGRVTVERHRSVWGKKEIKTLICINLKHGDLEYSFRIEHVEELISVLQLAVVYGKQFVAEMEEESQT